MYVVLESAKVMLTFHLVSRHSAPIYIAYSTTYSAPPAKIVTYITTR